MEKRKEGKKNERKTKNDRHEKKEAEVKIYIITAMKCVLKCHFLTVKYELGGSC
jgi:hypothetical protein